MHSASTASASGLAPITSGVALVFQRWLAPFAVVIALAAPSLTPAPCIEKRRIEAGAGLKVALWKTWLYWICWLALAVVIACLSTVPGEKG